MKQADHPAAAGVCDLPEFVEARDRAVGHLAEHHFVGERVLVDAVGDVEVIRRARLAEISAWIAEHCFPLLDAPVMRCASLDTPVPFAGSLEKNFLAKARLDKYIQQLTTW